MQQILNNAKQLDNKVLVFCESEYQFLQIFNLLKQPINQC